MSSIALIRGSSASFTTEPVTTFGRFPPEIFEKIFLNTSIRTLFQIMKDEEFRFLTNNDSFWKRYFRNFLSVSSNDTRSSLAEKLLEIIFLTSEGHRRDLTIQEIKLLKETVDEKKKQDAIRLLKHIIFSPEFFNKVKQIDGLDGDHTSQDYWNSHFPDIENKSYEEVNQIVRKWVQDHKELYKIFNKCYTKANLESLPESFAEFAQIKDEKARPLFLNLYLYNNKLGAFPPSITEHFRDIKVLYLDENRLTFLPSSLRRLINLEKISLNYNQLTNVDVLSKLSTLRKIWLIGNNLRSLNWVVPLLQKLQRLYVEENPHLRISKKLSQVLSRLLIEFCIEQEHIIESTRNSKETESQDCEEKETEEKNISQLLEKFSYDCDDSQRTSLTENPRLADSESRNCEKETQG